MKIYLRGNTYWFKFELDGERYQFSTRSKDKRQAERIAATVHADFIRKKFSLPVQSLSVLTIKESFEEYLKNTLCGKTWSDKKADLARLHIIPFFKNKPVKNITRSDVESYLASRRNEIINMPKNKNKRESEISFKSANLELAILHHFFAWCKDRGICGDNPADGVKKLKELRREIYISPEEQERLINCAAPHLKAFIKFSALTGLRTGDALNLKWQDIDIEHGVMRVFVAKTRQQKVMPLSDIAVETLKTIDKNGDYVFSYNGGRLASVKKSFATAVKKAGLAGRKGLTPHALRHIFVTRMSESGIDDATIRSATLHMSSEMSSRYRHLSPGALKNALNKAFGKPD